MSAHVNVQWLTTETLMAYKQTNEHGKHLHIFLVRMVQKTESGWTGVFQLFLVTKKIIKTAGPCLYI